MQAKFFFCSPLKLLPPAYLLQKKFCVHFGLCICCKKRIRNGRQTARRAKYYCAIRTATTDHTGSLLLLTLAKLFSVADRRPFTPNEILGTAQGVKIFAEWAPKTELFRRNRGYGEPAGLKELSLDGRSFDHPVKLQQVYYFVAYHRQNGLIRPIYRSAL